MQDGYTEANITQYCRNCDLKEDLKGTKKILLVGIGAIISTFSVGFGYFAHNQEETYTLLLEQKEAVTEMRTVQEYKILPELSHVKEEVRRLKEEVRRLEEKPDEKNSSGERNRD